jgi:ferritin-like metal-binding protein YciE
MCTHGIATLDGLFLHELSGLLDAERRFLGAQRAMFARASAAGLRAFLAEHLAESEGHVDALGEAFAALDIRPRRVASAAAEGLVVEAERALEAIGGRPRVRDCAIASAMARVEHYEVAAYRGLVAAAKEMERDDLVEILLGNLEQEEEAAARAEAAIPGLLRAAMTEVVEG